MLQRVWSGVRYIYVRYFAAISMQASFSVTARARRVCRGGGLHKFPRLEQAQWWHRSRGGRVEFFGEQGL